jgi:threonine dehydratase
MSVPMATQTPADDLAANILAMIGDAQKRIYGLARETPVELLSGEDRVPATARVYLKLEHLQKTGSFKLRGATKKVMSLSHAEAAAGVVTSSTGNHALGVATAAKHRGIDAEVFVSTQVSEEKVRKIEECGARIRVVGDNTLNAELVARQAASDSGRTYISPYNDPFVIAGQGTIGPELCRQVQRMDAVYIAAGGGGLLSGVGTYLRAMSPHTEMVGCWPENSRILYESIRSGRLIDFPETYTLSESTAGGMEAGSITFPLASKVMHRGILVSEAEILEAMRWAHQRRWGIEGAAAVALAAYFKEASSSQEKTVVILLCGGNPSPEVRKHLQ